MSSLDIRAIDETDLRKEPCPATKHELQVFLAEEAFDRAVERGDSDTTREIGGVLVGELLRDEGGPYLRIEGTIDALHAEEKGAELTFTHATWEHINKEMDTKHQGKRVVGWYHTHPGFGVFLSDRDQFIHKSFFNLPFQVAFVYDPKSKEHGLFTWRDNEVWRLRRYSIGAREHTWDGNRTATRPDEATEKSGVSASSDARGAAKQGSEDLSLNGSLGPLIVIAIVLVLLAGFAGHWIGSSSANSAIMQAQVEVTKARIEGGQIAIAQLQNELVGLLRETLGDQAVRKPVVRAIGDLDTAIASLETAVAPASGSGSGSAAATGAGSAAATGAGSAAATGAGSAAATGAGSAAGAAPVADRLARAILALKTARESFYQLSQDRGSAEAVLANIQRATRPGSELRTDLVHEVAEQRSGVGGLYAELAADAAKAGDPRRARRLLATAAHLDPGNRSRYEKQLQSFDKDATLPREPGDREGSAGVAPAITTIPGATTVVPAPAAPTLKGEGKP